MYVYTKDIKSYNDVSPKEENQFHHLETIIHDFNHDRNAVKMVTNKRFVSLYVVK